MPLVVSSCARSKVFHGTFGSISLYGIGFSGLPLVSTALYLKSDKLVRGYGQSSTLQQGSRGKVLNKRLVVGGGSPFRTGLDNGSARSATFIIHSGHGFFVQMPLSG